MDIRSKISDGVSQLKTYWNKPPQGRYMTFREIVSLSVGGLGAKFVVYCVQYMILGASNTLIGNTIGIAPKEMYLIYLLSVFMGIPLAPLRAHIIDNVHHKKGKYRPYVLSMGLPTAILGIGFVWMPYEHMTMLWKCVTVLLFNIGFQFFYQFYYDVDLSIVNVLSPNTIERSDVNSIKTVTDSFAPTIGNFIVPLLASVITGKNTLVDMRIYRWVYPPMILFGFLLGLLMYFNTEEKIVQPKSHKVNIKFSDALRAVVHNKYFWIISMATWIGFLETAVQSVMDWLYSYQDACSAMEYSIIIAIRGNASLWPMLFVPFLIRAMGKRKLLVSSNILNIIFIIIMLPIIRNGDLHNIIWIILVCFFFNYMAATVGALLTPSLNGDIRDYQQYITGERIDGMFVTVGVIGSIITLCTNSVLPAIYDKAGLNETVALSLGYDGSNVYDVLHNEMYFRNICSVLILAATVGATLNVIPYFFYDLTELKQKAMVSVLKIRVMFEDFGNGLSDEALCEAVELIERSKELDGKDLLPVSRKSIRQAKKAGGKAQKKLAKKQYKQDKQTNEDIQIAAYVVRELERFSTPEGMAELAEAERTVAAGLGGLRTMADGLSEAKAMPKHTSEQKQARRAAIDRAKAVRTAQKTIAKHFADGLTVFDSAVLDRLFAEEDKCSASIDELYRTLHADSTDSARKAELKAQIKQAKSDKNRIKKQIKAATNQYTLYTRAAKPYLDAQKLIRQKESYDNYPQMKAEYDRICCAAM